MDAFVTFSVFLLCLFLPLTGFSLFTRSIPKLKMRDAAPYLHEIASIKDFVNIRCVDEEDIRHMKARITHSVAFPVLAIIADILAVAGGVNFAKNEEVTLCHLALYIATVGLLSVLCLYRGVKNAKVFRNAGNFSKRNGILLGCKEIYVQGIQGQRGTTVYQVLIGTYDDKGIPIVFKTEIPEFIFKVMQRNDKWSVIMYQGRPACIIKG